MTPTFRTGRLAAALAIALAAVACGGNDVATTPTPVPTLSESAAPATPLASAGPTAGAGASASPSTALTCDESVTGSPAVSDDSDPNAPIYTGIEGQVQELRGITATTPVARGVFDTAGLCAYLRQGFAKDNPADLVAATETFYKHLLLMPEDESLQQLYLDLLTSQVAGLYDNDDKHMYVVAKNGAIGPAEEITYAHEFTHALQDQRFILKSIMGEDLDQSDRSMARAALVEGDATLLMSLWAQQNMTAAELGQVAGSVDPASQAVLERMPAILKDPLLFPYTQGLSVALGAFTNGGYAGVDELYANPPASTEQVLHPDKLASREAPVAVTFPDDLAARLGDGWRVSMQDTMGELLLSIMLKEGGADAPNDAAAGWGGDRIAVIEGPGGEISVVMDTAWDTSGDADEFATALEPYVAKLNAAGRSASVLRPTDGRVVMVSATSADVMGRVANVLGLAG